MKKTLGLIAIFVVACLVLAGCNKKNEEIANPASVYCEQNGGTLEIINSETGVYWECTLPDWTVCEEWDYFEGRCPSSMEAISMTSEQLDEIIDNNFPTSYTYTVYNLIQKKVIQEHILIQKVYLTHY